MAGGSARMTSPILRSVFLGLTASMACCSLAAAAEPVYTQYACHLADGTAAPADGFTATMQEGGVAENRCAAGGGLTMVLPDGPVASSRFARWDYTPPPGTTIAAFSGMRSIRNVRDAGADTQRMYLELRDSAVHDWCGQDVTCVPDHEMSIREPSEILKLVLSCITSPCSGSSSGDGVVSVDRIAVTLRDENAPQFTAVPDGDLFDAEPVRGTRTVNVSASDVGGGVYRAALIVDGVEQAASVLDANGGACAKPFVNAVPCKSLALGTLALDTTQLTDGNHSVGVAVYDATEVNRAEYGPVAVTVDNATVRGSDVPGASGGTGGAASNHVAFTLRGRHFRRGTVRRRHGQPLGVSGRLLGVDAAPIAGEVLRVFTARDTPGATYRQLTTVRTDTRGRFAFRLPAGPNRKVLVGSALLGEVGRFVVRVPAPVRLEPSRKRLSNKEQLVLSASLHRATAPARSATVAFQVRIGDQWRTFATRELNGRGRATIRHRFRVTFQRMTYRFRAVIVRRRNFPYDNAASAPVAVQVN